MYTDIDFTNISVRAYCRKSSEQDERQALSVESQVEAAKNLAKDLKITLRDEDILQESKSAKKSHSRPLFDRLIQEIENGKIQGIICWHPDRLSRNAGDAGRLIDLIDAGNLKFILTKPQVFRNTPSDKFFFSMLCSQAKMENDNKGINVSRGLVKKRQMGYPPSMGKIGYMNDHGEKGYRKILPDPDRIELVRQIFQMYLTGKYSAGELYRVAVEDIGLTTIQRKRQGGTSIKRSQFYKMLKDPFYAGFFMGKDEQGEMIRYEVNPSVPRLITEAEHIRITKLLKRTDNCRPWSHVEEFPYKQFAKCGNCEGSITAEKKEQLICSDCKYKFSIKSKTACPKCSRPLDGKRLTYIYYHCCKKKDPYCPKGSVTEPHIRDRLIREVVNPLAISPELKEWCLNSIGVLEQEEQKRGLRVNENWYNRLIELDKQDQQAVGGYTKGLIEDQELAEIRKRIQEEKAAVRNKIGLQEGQGLDLRELDRKFDILTEIRDIIENGSYEEKVEALSTLGSNLTIKAKNLSVSKEPLYEAIQKGLLRAKTENPGFEPEKTQANKDETGTFVPVRPTLLRG